MTNEVQHVFFEGSPNLGTFTLALDAVVSAPIVADPTTDELTAGLEGMANIGPGNVFVTKPVTWSYHIEFIAELGHQPMSLLVADGTELNRGTVSVEVLTAGAPVPGVPPGGNSANYFLVTGFWVSVESAAADSAANALMVEPIAAEVTFYPRLADGTSIQVPQLVWPDSSVHDTAVVLAPVSAQIVAGQLCTINADATPGVQLLCNAPTLGLSEPLIYDVDFPSVTYNAGTQALSGFGFEAPQDSTPVCLSDPGLARLEYLGPIPGGR